jgi:hypothetical protein
VTPDDDKDFQRSEARGAELRDELAATDARRAEEETAKAHDEVAAAEKREAEAEAKQRDLEQKAEQAHKIAERERAEADQAAATQQQTGTQSVSGGRIASPGLGSNTDPNAAAAAPRSSQPGSVAMGGGSQSVTDKPEVMIGAAFAGAFVFAQVLKRLVD